MELIDDNALRAVYDKGAAIGHNGNIAHIDRLLTHFHIVFLDEADGRAQRSGEIDIMENKGSDAYTTTSALHYLNGNQQGDYQVGGYAFSQRNKEGTIEDWHTYYVVWDADEFNFYVDDHLKLTVPKRTWHPAGGKAYTSDDDFPFNKNFYVILNLAIGGTFDGGREPDADFVSAEMQVDYVRMYQFK
ncbi:MAG: Glucan endo-1,3-beta-glucosidase A1 precursor [Tenericutes bacterium ADurb.BinA155]|nr:MAG: Glucan endo-1,3-beta-glucosidase A1 precursor [Tenericutes bacterium ADurb.BinA155]